MSYFFLLDMQAFLSAIKLGNLQQKLASHIFSGVTWNVIICSFNKIFFSVTLSCSDYLNPTEKKVSRAEASLMEPLLSEQGVVCVSRVWASTLMSALKPWVCCVL